MSVKTSLEHLVTHAEDILKKLESPSVKSNAETVVKDLEAALAAGKSAVASFTEGGLENDLSAAKDAITAVENLARAVKSAYSVIESL